MASEYWAKVALLASLTIVCAARPLIILRREAHRAARARPASGAPAPRRSSASIAALGAAAFAALLVAAGTPARSVAGLSGGALATQRPGHDRAHPQRRLDPAAARGARSPALRSSALAGEGLRTTGWRPSTCVSLQAVDQAPPTVVATLTGEVTQGGATTPFTRVSRPGAHARPLRDRRRGRRRAAAGRTRVAADVREPAEGRRRVPEAPPRERRAAGSGSTSGRARSATRWPTTSRR